MRQQSLLLVTIALLLASIGSAAKKDKDTGGDPTAKIIKEVRHELVTLPYYSLFDNLAFRVDGNTVTLLGQVTRPTLKSDAERVIRDLPGVETVNNQIEVLQLSPNDDRIRQAAFQAIYSQAPLQRYTLSAVPPIHIIVKNGNITLEGVVANDGDRNIANIAANQVPGAFSVTNHLLTDKEVQGAR